MHLRGRSDPDMRENSVQGCICEGKVILICRKVCSGMHLQAGNDPDLQESLFRDAFAREK